MNEVVVRYVRHPNTNRTIGCVVGVNTSNGIMYGFSQCNPKDQFNRKKGREIAIQRALVGSSAVPVGVTFKVWYPSEDIFQKPQQVTHRNVDLFTDVFNRVQALAERAFANKS